MQVGEVCDSVRIVLTRGYRGRGLLEGLFDRRDDFGFGAYCDSGAR
jgi:hypothetical protein